MVHELLPKWPVLGGAFLPEGAPLSDSWGIYDLIFASIPKTCCKCFHFAWPQCLSLLCCHSLLSLVLAQRNCLCLAPLSGPCKSLLCPLRVDAVFYSGAGVKEKAALCVSPLLFTQAPRSDASGHQMGWGVPHTKQFSVTPAECPIIQFWHYLPGDSISSYRLRAQSHKVHPLPFRSQSQVTYTYDQLTTNQGSHNPFLGFKILLEWPTELRETFTDLL